MATTKKPTVVSKKSSTAPKFRVKKEIKLTTPGSMLKLKKKNTTNF